MSMQSNLFGENQMLPLGRFSIHRNGQESERDRTLVFRVSGRTGKPRKPVIPAEDLNRRARPEGSQGHAPMSYRLKYIDRSPCACLKEQVFQILNEVNSFTRGLHLRSK